MFPGKPPTSPFPGRRNISSPQKFPPLIRKDSGKPKGFFLIFGIGTMFFIILILIVIVSVGSRKRVQQDKDRSSDAVVQKESNVPAPVLPEGKLGNLAKGVVLILSVVGEEEGKQLMKSGTGFIISTTGTILTNEHVVSDAIIISVHYHTGEERAARIVKMDADLDVAQLQAGTIDEMEPLKLSRENSAGIGRKIIVFGFPHVSNLGSEITLTSGLISSIRRSEDGTHIWYQISASVNPGNSGGPMLDEATGEVLGIVTAKMMDAEGIGFARPLALIREKFLGTK